MYQYLRIFKINEIPSTKTKHEIFSDGLKNVTENSIKNLKK